MVGESCQEPSLMTFDTATKRLAQRSSGLQSGQCWETNHSIEISFAF